MKDDALLDFLKRKFGKAKRASKGWIRIPCPTCTPKDAQKMKRGVHPVSHFTKCWICENPISFDELVEGEQFTRAETSKAEVQEEHPQAKQYPFKKIIPINALDPDHPAVKFLHKDQLYRLDDYWNEHQIGFISNQNAIDICFEKNEGKETRISSGDSIMFPVYFQKQFIGWQLRFIPGTWNGDKMGKMKYLHVFLKGKYVWNYDNCKQYDNIVVVEGIKKALKFPNAVSTLGKSITEEQIQIIQEWDRIALMYDGDDKAQELARKIAMQINAGPRTCINIDPRDYGFATPDEGSEEACQWAVTDSWRKYDERRTSRRDKAIVH